MVRMFSRTIAVVPMAVSTTTGARTQTSTRTPVASARDTRLRIAAILTHAAILTREATRLCLAGLHQAGLPGVGKPPSRK